jgi:CRP-like cAMP-binding protein
MRSPAHVPTGARFPVGNAILAGLAGDDLRLLEPIEPVRLPARWALFNAGDALKHVFFPSSGVVSFVEPDKRGAMVEIAQVGAEGMIGLTGLFGAEHARHRALVQLAGEAYRVPLSSARRAFAESRLFQKLALTYGEVLIRQLSQSVVCKLNHSVEQQLCQRLLLYAARQEGAPLEMTHEQIAEALGSRRQGVTEAARRLQAQQVIRYSRGRITVLDRAALERYACECYRVMSA